MQIVAVVFYELQRAIVEARIGKRTPQAVVLRQRRSIKRRVAMALSVLPFKVRPLRQHQNKAGLTKKPGFERSLSAKLLSGAMVEVTQDGELARNDDTPHRMKTLGIIGAPAILLVVASLVLMLAQRPYFEWQYAQSHSHAPLYTSSLAQNDGLWSALPYTRFDDGALEFVEETTAMIP